MKGEGGGTGGGGSAQDAVNKHGVTPQHSGRYFLKLLEIYLEEILINSYLTGRHTVLPSKLFLLSSL